MSLPIQLCGLSGCLLSFLFTSRKEAWTTSLKFKPSAMVVLFCMYVYVYSNIIFLIMSRYLIYLQMSLCSCEFARYRWRRPHGRGGPQQAMSRPHGVHLFRLRLVEDTSWCLVGHPTNHPKLGNLFRVRLCLGDQPHGLHPYPNPKALCKHPLGEIW